MIEKIKEKLWGFLEEKKISLVMIFDNTGDIVWYKGRTVRGSNISTSEGFARTYIIECMRSLKEISKDNVSTIESNGKLSLSAMRLYLKSVVVIPLENDYFLYFDSGTKKGFSTSDLAFIKAMGSLLKDTISNVKNQNAGSGGICSISTKMDEVRKKILKISFNSEPVLFLGETGVGKTFIAEFIHKYSGRKGRFINADITTMNENIFESTFFGHKRGAFTDAMEDKKGLVEEAEGGTLFIDEISEIPISFQSKLLKFIDTKRYRVLGETRERVADVRIVAATNKDMNKLISEKEFKEDLYYRVSIFEITIPPLRERKDDIRHFIEENKSLINGKTLTEDFFEEVNKYNWPGNIRELKTMLIRAGALLESPINGVKIKEILSDFCQKTIKDIKGLKTEKIWEELRSGQSFWDVVKKPYLNRDLNRKEVMGIIEKGLSENRRSYTDLIKSFNIEKKEYKKFMNFLTVHKLSSETNYR